MVQGDWSIADLWFHRFFVSVFTYSSPSFNILFMYWISGCFSSYSSPLLIFSISTEFLVVSHLFFSSMPRWCRECGLSLIYDSIGSFYWQSYSHLFLYTLYGVTCWLFLLILSLQCLLCVTWFLVLLRFMIPYNLVIHLSFWQLLVIVIQK